MIDDLVGRIVRMPIRRFASAGAYLIATEEREFLLPNSEIPEGAKIGDELDVFVHHDSEDRPIATLRTPKLLLDQVAFLEVKDIASFGAFVDWGLVKELLVPLGEQTREMHRGDRHPVGLIIDDTGRLAGTMRVSEMLRDKPPFELGAWVSGEAWRNHPDTGMFAILERTYVGRMPPSEPHKLKRGDAAKFRVTNILNDGKVEISLRDQAHAEIDGDGRRILEALARPEAANVGEHASPEQIRETFGLSKKAFKRAAGRLFKDRLIDIDADGKLIRRTNR